MFTYGIWENYVEQLAIELAQKVADKVPPKHVPERIRKPLEKGTAWQLAVSPGWRRLWVQKVELQAIGDDGEKYGLNTAKAGQVKSLLGLRGEIVHTGTVPDTLRKNHVREWRQFVESITGELDKNCRNQCKKLLT